MRLAWATDVHLNFLDEPALSRFTEALVATGADAIALTGDIAEAPSIEGHLTRLAQALDRPVYFVLGNHDFYRGSIAGVRAQMATVHERDARLFWLNAHGVIAATERTCLVGHDAYADARLGNARQTPVMLTDFILIEELRGLWRDDLVAALNRLGDQAAEHLREHLPRALARCDHVVVLLHAPPFREACWHEGAISNDDWLPWFTCKAAGDALVEVLGAHPQKRATVLCGHTHSGGVAQVLPNLTVKTGPADYGAPAVVEVLELG